MYLFVPTRLVEGMSTESRVTSCLTANPKSPITQVKLDFTNMFLDLRSL